MMNSFGAFAVGEIIHLEPTSGWPKKAVHTFSEEQATAILAAKEIGRPLLIRGEPGCGKTQMARAAAHVLKMPLALLVVNERTEAEDLLWKYDALRRLSDAHNPDQDVEDESRYLSAGPLWWALDHVSAEENIGIRSSKPFLGDDFGPDQDRDEEDQPEENAKFENGVLLLIDEIDKADRAVPNGLLEVLGNYSFDVPYIKKRIECRGNQPPLILITTNDEQELPPAFVRRCLVLDIGLPKDETAFIETLSARGRGLFPTGFDSTTVYEDIAKQLWEKRRQALAQQHSFLPGQAEYLDHLEAVLAIKRHRPEKEDDIIRSLAELAYQKNRNL
ncbi:MAG: AAA domain-containing protein [Gammaproteobacteria bacterium]|nr:AAA domain-containing protein [Gammaproteobacteria bacterium]